MTEQTPALPKEVAVTLLDRVHNLHDGELTGMAEDFLTAAQVADNAGRHRVRSFLTNTAMVLQAEMIRRESIYSSVMDQE